MSRRIALVLASLLVLSPIAGAVARPASVQAANPWLERRVLHIAHQGGEVEAPSNTMFACKTATDKGADVVELDVHATADGELVVIHDATVDRTTDGSGRIDQMTLEELKALDAAHWFVPECGTCHDKPVDAYAYRGFATGARPIPPELSDFEPNDFTIPTLREVLQTFPRNFINIEIKSTAPETKPYEDKLAALLEEFGRTTDTIVVSFLDHAIMRSKRSRCSRRTSRPRRRPGRPVLSGQRRKGRFPESRTLATRLYRFRSISTASRSSHRSSWKKRTL